MEYSEKFNMKERVILQNSISSVEDALKQDYVMRQTALVTYLKASNRILAQIEDKEAELHIVDVGVGNGMVSIYISGQLKNASISGLEEDEYTFEAAKNNLDLIYWSGAENDVEFEQSRLDDLPIEDKSADIVISHATLHTWANPEKVLMECNRICKDSGIIIIDDCNRYADESSIIFVLQYIEKGGDEFLQSVRESYNTNEVKEILKKASLDWYVYENDMDIVISSKELEM